MNRKGFTLVEMLGCLAILCLILCVGFFVTKDTLATTLSTLTDVSESQVIEAAGIYVLENKTSWINDGNEYTCLSVQTLVDVGYFNSNEVLSYKNRNIKVVRNSVTKVIDSVNFVNVCE